MGEKATKDAVERNRLCIIAGWETGRKVALSMFGRSDEAKTAFCVVRPLGEICREANHT